MNQKDLSQQLGSMVSGQINSNSGNDDCLPSELTSAPSFEVEHESEIEKARKQAMKTIECIVDAVVPEEYKNHPSIKNQMEVDATQLGSVLYIQNMNNVMIENSMTSISTGNDNPRMYEVTEKFYKRSSELVAQITELYAQYRKYYIDTYLDIESKKAADESEKEELHLIENKKDNNILGVETSNGGIRFIGKQSTEALIQHKKEQAKLQKQLEKEKQDAEKLENETVDAEIIECI